MLRFLAVLLYATASVSYAGGVYKCPQADGSIAYQATPCPQGQKFEVSPPPPSSSSPAATKPGPAKPTSSPTPTNSGLRPSEQQALDTIRAREARQEAAEQQRKNAGAKAHSEGYEAARRMTHFYCNATSLECDTDEEMRKLYGAPPSGR